MENNYKEIVKKLMFNNKTISTMESCTGGALVNTITNIEGASEVLKYSAITYSNEYKIKMGVDGNIIDNYSVYSIETAKEMSKKISDFTNSNYGVGITGKLNREDSHNLYGSNNLVYISVYDKDNNKYTTYSIKVSKKIRKQNKNKVISFVGNILLRVIE